MALEQNCLVPGPAAPVGRAPGERRMIDDLAFAGNVLWLKCRRRIGNVEFVIDAEAITRAGGGAFGAAAALNAKAIAVPKRVNRRRDLRATGFSSNSRAAEQVPRCQGKQTSYIRGENRVCSTGSPSPDWGVW